MSGLCIVRPPHTYIHTCIVLYTQYCRGTSQATTSIVLLTEEIELRFFSFQTFVFILTAPPSPSLPPPSPLPPHPSLTPPPVVNQVPERGGFFGHGPGGQGGSDQRIPRSLHAEPDRPQHQCSSEWNTHAIRHLAGGSWCVSY